MAADGTYHLAAGQAERRWMGGTFADFLATGDLTGDAFAIIDERARRGEAVPLHMHAADAESFYVLEGEMTFFLGDRTELAGPASFVHIAAGLVHGFRVESDTARYLILTTARHGEFYRAISDATPGLAVDWERIGHACEEYGVQPVGDLPPAE
jgi:quercetin dioxygenase-like cupin family protein